MKILKEQKKLYYILGKAFMYEEKDNDKNDIKKVPVKTKVKYRAHNSNQDTPQTAPEGDKSQILSENFKLNDLSVYENTEEEKTEIVEEKFQEVQYKEDVQKMKEIEKTEEIEKIEEIEEIEEIEGVDIMTETNLTDNKSEYNEIFKDTKKTEAFGYQQEQILSIVHDICTKDVRDICVKETTLAYCIPCNTDGIAGCRGGFLPDGPPTVQSYRLLCADENLSPTTGCDRIINNVEFEVVLRFGSTVVVVTPKDTITCMWYEFAKFPSGTFYPNNSTGLNQFRNELTKIDGSCKVIVVENVRVGTNGNDCMLFIDYKIVDKLWKHENLLVLAVNPYEENNTTVCQIFEQGHRIGSCTNSGPCSGIPVAASIL